jgi:hypothetical protein
MSYCLLRSSPHQRPGSVSSCSAIILSNALLKISEIQGLQHTPVILRDIIQCQWLCVQELRQLVYDKWGKSYDVRIMQRSGSTYMHIMWKHLEQQSFPLTEEEYQEQLDAVAELCSVWGVSEVVRSGIQTARARGPGISVGGAARAIQITLGRGLDMMGGTR